MKVCDKCENEIATKDGDNTCESCQRKEEKRVKRNAAARARRAAYESCGLVRVSGAMGGVYWE